MLTSSCTSGAGVDGCGVSIRDTAGNPVTVHATNAVATAIEDLQMTLGEGPCVEVGTSGSAVMVADLRDRSMKLDERWPAFRDEAERLGVRALFAFPLRVGPVALGVVDLYRATPGPLSKTQVSSAFTAVDSIGRHLLMADGTDQSAEPEQSFELVVHQAAGVVMMQLDSSVEEALVRLRASAYAAGRPVADLAQDVVRGDIRFRKEDT